MLFALGFVTMFVIGGLSGIYLGSVPIDIAASDTYFIVAHIHYVLFGGSVFTIYAGVYYWFPKMTGRMYSETLGKWHFWLTFVSFNATFFPMHYVGLRGMPRRVRLRRGVRRPEPLHLDRVLRARRLVRLFVYNMSRAGSAAHRRREPVARAHARVAGLLAAADLQLRRDPAGRRRSARVRRPRRAPRDPEPAKEAQEARVTDRQPTSSSWSRTRRSWATSSFAIRRRAERGRSASPSAPVTPPREGYVVYRDSRRAAAGRRLDRVLAALRLAGIPRTAPSSTTSRSPR